MRYFFVFCEGVRLVPRIDALERHTTTEGNDDDGADEENDDGRVVLNALARYPT